MSYDPYVNSDRQIPKGALRWLPSRPPSGNGVIGLGWRFLVLKRGRFRNDYYINSSDKTLTVDVALTAATSNTEDYYFPINNSFRKLQTPNKNVRISGIPIEFLGTEFAYTMTLAQASQLSTITVKYTCSVDIFDAALLGFMETSTAENKEADIEKVKQFRARPQTTIMDIDWSKYSFLKIKVYTSTDEASGVEWPSDNSELKATGYFYEKFDSSEKIRNANVRFANSINQSDFKILSAVKIFNESQVNIKVTIHNIMLFTYAKVNLEDDNLPCSHLSYAIPVDINIQVENLLRQIYWPNTDLPTFSLKLFCPDDKINSRGFAHSLQIRFLIAAFEDYFANFFGFPNAWVIFVGPTVGRRSSVFYLTPEKIRGTSGLLIRVNDVPLKVWADKIIVQKIDSPTLPSSQANWTFLFEFVKGEPLEEQARITEVSDLLFLDLDGKSTSWYRLIQRNRSTGLSEESSPFKGQIYAEESILELNTTGVSRETSKTLIRTANLTSNFLNQTPLAIFELSSEEDYYPSTVQFKKGVFKFNFSGKALDPDFLVTSHVYLRMWFHPGSEPVDVDDPTKYRTSETEIILQKYTNSTGGTSTRIAIGTPSSLDDLLVSAPLFSETNNYEILKFTDGLTQYSNMLFVPFKNALNSKIVVGLYVYSYLNDKNNPNLIDEFNPPNYEIVIDANSTVLEIPLLKTSRDAFFPIRYFDYNSVATTITNNLPFYLSNETYLENKIESSDYFPYDRTFFKVDSSVNPSSYAYENLITLQYPATAQKLLLKIPRYSNLDDNSIYYFVDFVTKYNSFINSKVNQGTISIKINFNLDFDNSKIINKIKFAAFFVSRYGNITERIFMTSNFELPATIADYTYTKQVSIKIPFYVSNNDCQIVFRLYYYPFSSTGSELTAEEIEEIKKNLNGKPEGLRINDIQVSFSAGLLTFSNRVETTAIGTVNYEDLPLVPSASLDSQQFWFASPDEDKFKIYLQTNDTYRITGLVYSPTWIVNLPDDMEADIRANLFIFDRTIVYRTVPRDERIFSDEKLSAIESDNQTKTVHVAKNSVASDTVNALTVYNQINYYRLHDPISTPHQEGLVAGYNNVPLFGENPHLQIFDFFETNNDRSIPAILVQDSDEESGYNKIAISNANGFANKWEVPNESSSFEENLVLQYANELNKSAMAFDKNNKNLYIAGHVSPGSVVLKILNFKNPGTNYKTNSTGRSTSKVIGYNYLIDGVDGVAYDIDQPLTIADNLSGTTVLETFTGLGVDDNGNALVAYVLDGSNNKISARMVYSTTKSISNIYVVADMGQLTASPLLSVFCPVVQFYNSMFYVVFWCAGKLFLTKFGSLPVSYDASLFNVNPVYYIAGNSNFDENTNQAHPILKQLYLKDKILINKFDPNSVEVDLNMQAAGMIVSTNPRFAGDIFVYYKLPSGDLIVKQVSPGGLVSNPQKIGD